MILLGLHEMVMYVVELGRKLRGSFREKRAEFVMVISTWGCRLRQELHFGIMPEA